MNSNFYILHDENVLCSIFGHLSPPHVLIFKFLFFTFNFCLLTFNFWLLTSNKSQKTKVESQVLKVESPKLNWSSSC